MSTPVNPNSGDRPSSQPSGPAGSTDSGAHAVPPADPTPQSSASQRSAADNPTRSNPAPEHSGPEHSAPTSAATTPPTSKEVVRAQKERFGGMKFGACFFGWLTATGTAVLLTGLLTAAGTALGLADNVTAGQATQNAETIGLAGGIALLVVLFLAYLAGGYVAGRMARFSGAKQGVGVWLWAVIIAVVVAILTAIAGARYNVLANLNLPRIPINEGTLTTGGIITAIAVVLVTLLGAVLGGILGMRYHRKIDRMPLDHIR